MCRRNIIILLCSTGRSTKTHLSINFLIVVQSVWFYGYRRYSRKKNPSRIHEIIYHRRYIVFTRRAIRDWNSATRNNYHHRNNNIFTGVEMLDDQFNKINLTRDNDVKLKPHNIIS